MNSRPPEVFAYPYKSLSEEGDPRLTTLLGVMRALGVKLSAEIKPAA